MSDPLSYVFLARPGLRTPKEPHAFTLEEDFSYLANLINEAHQEELSSLAYYTHRASTVLAIDEAGHWDDIFSDQHIKEK